MRRSVTTLITLGCGIAIAGCGITGNWEVAAIDPPGAPFPAEHLTFDRDHNYTAIWTQNGRTCTDTGRYRWNGFRLDIIGAGSQPRIYGARRGFGGKLVLTYKEGKGKVVAHLVKVEE